MNIAHGTLEQLSQNTITISSEVQRDADRAGFSETRGLSPLTSGHDWAIVSLDLATTGIRARKHRGTPGSLGNMKVVSEAYSSGANLIPMYCVVKRQEGD
jgi:hypothetical protein